MDSIEMREYARKSFRVRAVQISEENILQLAAACGGEYRESVDVKGWVRKTDPRHIYLKRGSRTGDRQNMGFIGDWLLLCGASWRFYSDKAFRGVFEAPKFHWIDTKVEVEQIVRQVMRMQDDATFHNDANGDMDLVVQMATDKIMGLIK